MANCFSVLGVKIDIATIRSAVNDICTNINNGKKTMVVTANPEIIMMCQSDEYYKKAVSSADYIFADGIGVVWAGRHSGHVVPERVTGFDLAQELFKQADIFKYKIFLFGAQEGVAQKVTENIGKKYPNIEFVGYRNGFFSEADTSAIVEQINASAPDILLVALGAPKQEKWIFDNKAVLNCKLFMGIGGCFDIWAGNSKRAPLLFQKTGLEWFYRLCKEPKRFKRMFSIPRFVCSVLLSKKS